MRNFLSYLWALISLVAFPIFVLSRTIDAVQAAGGSSSEVYLYGIGMWTLATSAGFLAMMSTFRK